MSVLFNNVPHNIRVPLFYAELNAGGTPYQAIQRLLLIGQPRTDRAVVTITEANPGVVSWAGHPLSIGSRVKFTTSDTLPANLVSGTTYYVAATGFTANSFQLAATAGGESIDTSGGSAAGTHTAHGLVGTAELNKPLLMQDGKSDGLLGLGSMLAEMYKVARKNAPAQEIWAMAVEDSLAGVAATGTITVVGDAVTQARTLTLYVQGERVRIAVRSSDTNAQIAANLAAEINATPGLQVTAAVNGGTAEQVDLTARHVGALGNTLKINTDLVGDESAVAATKLAIVQLSGGSGDPDLTTPLDGLGDADYDWIAAPYSDATNLGAVSDLLNDVSGRWSPIQQLYGHYITAKDDTLPNLSTLGNGRNNPHETIMGYYNSPTPPWIWAAAIGGVTAAHLQTAPELSRPLQTLDLLGVVAPKLVDQFNIQERQVALYDGISCYHVERDNTVSIDRLITTYQWNEWGSPDATWFDVNTIAQSVYGIRYIKQKITNTHGRQALADSNPAGLQGIATPADVRSTFVHAYAELVGLGVFENLDLFERDLIVERSIDDANRLDCYLPLDHVNQLRIIAVNATSFLQRSSSVEELVSLAA